MIRIGIVDFDTSHVAAFTQRINQIDISSESFVDGGRVVAGFPGDSAIMPERIPEYAAKLSEYGVPLVERLEELLDGRVDAVLIESQQGARHLERARPFLEAGIPTFIDKPFTTTAAEADAVIALADGSGAPLMSCSALRYAPEVTAALARREEMGAIVGVDVWSSCLLHPGNPGLLHYGCHGVEMLYTLLGTGCREVRTASQPGADAVVGVWADGRIGTLRGVRDGRGGFGFTAHYERGHFAAEVTGAAFYTEMLKRVVEMFATGAPPIPYAEMREIVAFMDADRESRANGGAAARLA